MPWRNLATILHRLPKRCFALYEFDLMKSEQPSDLSRRAHAAQGDDPGVFGLVDHVRGLGGRSAACRKPHLRRDACSTGRRCRSTARSPVTTSGLPVAVSGAFDASDKTDMLVVIGGFGTRYEGTPALNAGLRRVARQARAPSAASRPAPGCSAMPACSKAARRPPTGRTWRISPPPSRAPTCGPTATSSTGRCSPPAAPRRPST